MSLDLTEAIEAAARAWFVEHVGPDQWDTETPDMQQTIREIVHEPVTAAAPIIEAQVRESIAADLTETVRLRREDREWSESCKDYTTAGWEGEPDDGERMFWSAGFKRGFDLAARIARGESR